MSANYPFIFKPHPFPEHLVNSIPQNILDQYRDHDNVRVLVYRATVNNHNGETSFYIQSEDGWKGVATKEELVLQCHPLH